MTSGADGDIRIWSGVDDDDPFTQCVGEFTVCVIQYAERVLVSNDLNVVQAYTFPECDRDGTEFRFTGVVNCIKVNEKYIAACSEDMIIKVTSLGDAGETFELSGGHTATILKIDLSVNDQLASSSGDGSICVWSLTDKKLIKTIEGLPIKTKSFTNTKVYGTPSFEPKTGQLLAYPKGREIVVVGTDNWEPRFTFANPNIGADYTTCEFSLCGKFVAAGTLSGEISVWDVVKKTAIDGDTKGEFMDGICSISWNPANNGEFVYCDQGGQLGLVENCYSRTVATEDRNGHKSMANGNHELLNEIDELYGVDDIQFEDDDNENCVSLEKLKNDTMRGNKSIDDDNLSVDGGHSSRALSRMSLDREPAAKSYPLQPPFQPSSTPVNMEHR